MQRERRPLLQTDISKLRFMKTREKQRTSRVAWLKAESIEEQMEVDDIAFSTVGVSLGSGRPSVGADEGSVDVV